jgi:hypothetical protein
VDLQETAGGVPDLAAIGEVPVGAEELPFDALPPYPKLSRRSPAMSIESCLDPSRKPLTGGRDD